jgi:hypothetical protein
LHNGLLLSEVSSSDGQSGGGNDWKTDWDTDNEEDKSVMEQVDRRVLWSSDVQVVEETADPGNKNPTNDQNQERRADRVHDSLEMTLVLCARNKRCSATNERHLGRVSDNGISFSTLAASCVVNSIGDILIDSERFSSHGRLIYSEDSVAGTVLLSSDLVLIILLTSRLTSLSLEFAEIFLVTVGVIVS